MMKIVGLTYAQLMLAAGAFLHIRLYVHTSVPAILQSTALEIFYTYFFPDSLGAFKHLVRSWSSGRCIKDNVCAVYSKIKLASCDLYCRLCGETFFTEPSLRQHCLSHLPFDAQGAALFVIAPRQPRSTKIPGRRKGSAKPWRLLTGTRPRKIFRKRLNLPTPPPAVVFHVGTSELAPPTGSRKPTFPIYDKLWRWWLDRGRGRGQTKARGRRGSGNNGFGAVGAQDTSSKKTQEETAKQARRSEEDPDQ